MSRIYPWIVWAAMSAALGLGLLHAPPERIMGEVQRIMYLHVGVAWNAFLAFLVVALASIAYLRTGAPRWDRLARSSAEIGVLFTSLTLISGSIWARAVWNTWWTWEPRLTTTLLLWFLYVGYLLLRAAGEGGPQPGRLAAVFGVLGFVDVPIVYLSVTWWRGLHPDVIGPEGVQLEPAMGQALLLSVIAVMLLHGLLLQRRLEYQRLADEVAAWKEVRWE